MRYRLQRHDGTDCSATMVPITVLRMVPIQRYRQYGSNSLIISNAEPCKSRIAPTTIFRSNKVCWFQISYSYDAVRFAILL